MSPAQDRRARLLFTSCGNWTVNDAAIAPPWDPEDVIVKCDKEYRGNANTHHRNTDKASLVPFYMLHEEGELRHVE